jgi:hypothetical protein
MQPLILHTLSHLGASECQRAIQSREMLEVMWYVCYTEIIGNNNKN